MKEIKNILVVRKHNQIGDMLCSLPLYAALKKKYPSANITLVASQTNYPIPYKEINPFIDDVLIYDKTSFFTILKFYYLLRKKKYDIGVVPSTIKLSRTSHIINYLSGAKLRVGVKSIDGVINKSASLLNVKNDFFWGRDKVHQSERNLQIAKTLGCELSDDEKEIPLILTEEKCKYAVNFIEENFPTYKKQKDDLFLGIHPGAGKIANTWSYKNFVEVITTLKNKYTLHLLITCGKVDKLVVAQITEELNIKGIPYVIADSLPILELAAIISKLDFYITNDTGTMHIAGKTVVNQISLFGPTHSYEWGPKGKNKINIQSPTRNISDILPGRVLYSITNLS